ncbi:hypothetical protein D3C81_1696210 [compost metagenome]
MLGKSLGLFGQRGDVGFGGGQRFAVLDQHFVLFGDDAPRQLRPLRRVLLALTDRNQEQLLETTDGDATPGDRAAQHLNVGIEQRAFAQLQVERGAAFIHQSLGSFALARGYRAHADQDGDGLFQIVIGHW